MRKLTKRSTAIIVASVVAVGAAGAAYAWSLSASGSTTASAAALGSITVSEVATTGTLYPTGSSGVSFKVTNNATYPIVPTTALVTSIGVKGAAGDCAADTVVRTSSAAVAIPGAVQLAPGATSATLTVPNAVKMLANAHQDCVGKTFTVNLSVDASTPGEPVAPAS